MQVSDLSRAKELVEYRWARVRAAYTAYEAHRDAETSRAFLNAVAEHSRAIDAYSTLLVHVVDSTRPRGRRHRPGKFVLRSDVVASHHEVAQIEFPENKTREDADHRHAAQQNAAVSISSALDWILRRVAVPVLAVAGALLHVYTAVTAFLLPDHVLLRCLAAVAAWMTPAIAELVVASQMWRETGSTLNAYSFWLLVWLALLIGYLLLAFIRRKLNERLTLSPDSSSGSP